MIHLQFLHLTEALCGQHIYKGVKYFVRLGRAGKGTPFAEAGFSSQGMYGLPAFPPADTTQTDFGKLRHTSETSTTLPSTRDVLVILWKYLYSFLARKQAEHCSVV